MKFSEFIQENIFDDDFDISQWREKIKRRGKEVQRKRITQPDVLVVYHGFNVDPASIDYTFDPSKSEQGLLWFTHKYVRGHDYRDYAKGKGGYVLQYPLQIQRHTDIVTYENGSQENKIPEDLFNQIDSTSNGRFMGDFDNVMELPQGWFFTYKYEKFIGTNQVLKVKPEQITS